MKTFETIRTPFHYIRVHSRNAETSSSVYRWKTTLELGDELYLFMPGYNEYSKKTVTEFVRAAGFDGSPAALFFIDTDGTAYSTSLLADHIIKRANGRWIYAKTGAELPAEWVKRNKVEELAAPTPLP